jgi:hypothetical protein
MLKRAHTGKAVNPPTGVEFAWRVHTAMENWTAKVDAKASILLAFQGGAFIFAVTTRSALTGVGPGPVVAGAISLVLLGLASACAATAVLPVLGSSRRHRAESADEWIYFGHVRLWAPAELAGRLSHLRAIDEMQTLSRQLVRMSRLVWRKHRLVQGSVLLTLAAMLAMLVAVAMRTGW